MKHMKKIIICFFSFISAMSVFSCTKDMANDNELSVSVSDSPQKAFAEVLSTAVFENQSLRDFIKSEALKQFDKDYDVFYPYVKNMEVEKNKTFRDYLLDYTDENSLTDIERAIPKLNILVPDWSWIGCFSINSWDSSDREVAVSYVSSDGSVHIYRNGQFEGVLPGGSFPEFPVLIIKSNERLSYSPSTRGAEIEYALIDDAFNNTHTRVEHEYYYPIIDGTPDISNFVPASQVNYRVKEAYQYFPAGANSIFQRDYLYYNMTGEGQEKPRYNNIWEKIYKFKFSKFDIPALFDDKIDGVCYDFDRNQVVNNKADYKKNNSPMSIAELRSFFYAEGNLELMFMISVPSTGGSFSTHKTISVSFGDVFAINHANLDFRHKTWFCRDWYVYTVNIEAVKPKWCILNWQLPSWDISQDSSIITINVSEFDETGSNEFMYSTKKSIAHNFKADLTGDFNVSSVKCKVGLGYSYSHTNETTTIEKYVRNQGGVDDLGQADLEYLHPVLERMVTRNGVSGFEVKTITTGNVDLMILPFSY